MSLFKKRMIRITFISGHQIDLTRKEHDFAIPIMTAAGESMRLQIIGEIVKQQSVISKKSPTWFALQTVLDAVDAMKLIP
jgi:hypothetical protein